MTQAAAAPNISRQAARERAFRLLAGTVTALFLAFAALGGVFFWYDRAAGWLLRLRRICVRVSGRRNLARRLRRGRHALQRRNRRGLSGSGRFFGLAGVASAQSQ